MAFLDIVKSEGGKSIKLITTELKVFCFVFILVILTNNYDNPKENL